MANLLLFANVVALVVAVPTAVADVFSSPTVVVVAKLVGCYHFKTFDTRYQNTTFLPANSDTSF